MANSLLGEVSNTPTHDFRSFEAVYAQYCSYVHAVARQVSSTGGIAEEVTQDVFLAFWKHPEKFDPARGSLQAYLGTLAHHRAVDHVRRDASRTAREDRVASTTQMSIDDLPEQVLARDTSGRVRAAVAGLPAPQREVVELTYLDGYSFQIAARHLGIPEGTAKSRGRIALRRLGDALLGELAVA